MMYEDPENRRSENGFGHRIACNGMLAYDELCEQCRKIPREKLYPYTLPIHHHFEGMHEHVRRQLEDRVAQARRPQ